MAKFFCFAQGYFGKRHKKALGKARKSGAEGESLKLLAEHQRQAFRLTYNVERLTGITPDEPLGIPSEEPARWIMLGAAMGIQECGTEGFDQFAMLRGWEMSRG